MDTTLVDGWPRAIGYEFFGFSDVKPVAIADLDLDGTIEIVGAALFDSNVYVWRPDGTDAPGWPRQVFGSVVDFPSPPAVLDVDGNGDLEIVALTIDSHSLNILNHDGSRFPGYPMRFTAAIGSQCLTPWFQSPSLLDVDDDGDRDLIIRCTATLFALDVASRVVIWSNSIDAGALDPPGGAQVNGGIPAIGDLDADGEPEIITTGYQRLYVFRKNGEPYPGWPRQISSLDAYGRIRLLASPVSIADLDLDGRGEIIVEEGDADAFEPGTIHAIRADGTEAPGWPSNVPPTRRVLSGGPIVADMDTDGSPEVIVTTSHITVLDARGDPVPGWDEALIGLGPSQVSPPSVADLDDDGELEILVADPDGSDEEGEGARIYKRWVGSVWERNHGYATSTPVAGDFNKDGRLDIAAALHDVKTARQYFHVWKYPQTDLPRGRVYWPSYRFDKELTGSFRLEGVIGTGVDTDLDGFSDQAELLSGNSRTDSCSSAVDSSMSGSPSVGWPADLYTVSGSLGRSAGKINIQDLVTFMGPVRRLNSTPGEEAYDARWDVDGVEGVELPDLMAVVQFLGHHCE
jgi:hypothetical protein